MLDVRDELQGFIDRLQQCASDGLVKLFLDDIQLYLASDPEGAQSLELLETWFKKEEESFPRRIEMPLMELVKAGFIVKELAIMPRKEARETMSYLELAQMHEDGGRWERRLAFDEFRRRIIAELPSDDRGAWLRHLAPLQESPRLLSDFLYITALEMEHRN